MMCAPEKARVASTFSGTIKKRLYSIKNDACYLIITQNPSSIPR